MDHQLQKLARLGLEFERFDPRVHRIPFKIPTRKSGRHRL
jgi:hypothetical protein